MRQVAELIRAGRNVLVLVPPASNFKIEAAVINLPVRVMAAAAGGANAASSPESLLQRGLVAIPDFDCAGEVAAENAKAELIERLLANPDVQIAAVMRVPASGEDYRKRYPQFTVVDLRAEPFLWLEQYGPACDLIWEECRPAPSLWPLGAQLARDIGSEAVYSPDTIASEILDRADPYYRLLWSECSNEQKFVLSQLAEDGLVNPMNRRPLRQMVRAGLIVQEPEFRIMNESFRRFLRSAATGRLKQQWLAESRRTGWGRVHGAFFTTTIVLGIFLLTTQNALWESSAAYVTTAFGALGTLARLFNTVRGGGGSEKPN